MFIRPLLTLQISYKQKRRKMDGHNDDGTYHAGRVAEVAERQQDITSLVDVFLVEVQLCQCQLQS